MRIIMTKSDLPFGSEFSPSQIDLTELLEIADECQGKTKEMELKIQGRFFINKGGDAYNSWKLANNCRLGLKSYSIIDEDSYLFH